MVIVLRLVAGIANFFKPFLTKLFKGFGSKIFSGFSVFGGLIWNKIKLLADRMPFYIAWVTAFSLLFFTFMAGAAALIETLAISVPLSIVQAASWFLPSNIDLCVSVVMSSKLYRFFYDHKQMVLDARLKAFT